MKNKKMKHVWMVEEAAEPSGGARAFWTKIGIAYENDDGSLSLTLSAIPVTGKMQIRDPGPVVSAQRNRGDA